MRSLNSLVVSAIIAALFPLLANTSLQAQTTLSEVEQEMVRYIDSNTDRAIALLERTVNINSGSLNSEGVREVGQGVR